MLQSVSFLHLSKLDNSKQGFKKQALSTVSTDSRDGEMKATEMVQIPPGGLSLWTKWETPQGAKRPSEELSICLAACWQDSEKTCYSGKNAMSTLEYSELFSSTRITAPLLLRHGSITPTWIANNHRFAVQSIMLTFQKGNVISSRLQVSIIYFPSNCPANTHSFPTLFWKKERKKPEKSLNIQLT